MKKILFLILAFAACGWGADHHCIPGVTGGDGSTWSSPHNGLPSTLTRGDTYYLGKGAYGAYTADDAASGTDSIFLIKATTAAHGSATGWNDTLHGAATFTGPLNINTSYWVIDGKYGNRKVDSVYGIQIDVATTAYKGIQIRYYSSYTGAYVRIAHVDVEHMGMDLNDNNADCIYLFGLTADTVRGITMYDSWIHNSSRTLLYARNCKDVNIYRCYFEDRGNWTYSIHGQAFSVDNSGRGNWNIYDNIFHDVEGTGIITIGLDHVSAHSQFRVWNNLFFTGVPDSFTCSDGVFTSLSDNPLDSCVFYGNTIHSIQAPGASMFIFASDTVIGGGSGGNFARNNLLVGCDTGTYKYVSADYNGYYNTKPSVAETHQVTVSAMPFTDTTDFDYTLTRAVSGGVTLASPYDIDFTGATRGDDGGWDIGAYEYDAPTPLCTLTIAAGAGGTVSPSGAQSDTCGDTVQVVATPSVGNRFLKWTRSGTTVTILDSANDTTRVFRNDEASGTVTVTANFALIGTITVTDFGDHEVMQEMVSGNGAPDTTRIRDVGVTYTTATATYDSIRYKVLRWRDDSLVASGKFRNSTAPGTVTDTIQDVPAAYVIDPMTDTAWYRIAVYAYIGGAIDSSRGVNKWGVGQVIAFWGQSNMMSLWYAPQTHGLVDPGDNTGKYYWNATAGLRRWMHMEDTWYDSTNSNCDYCHTIVPPIVRNIIDSTHRLIGVCGYVVGGSVLGPSGGSPNWLDRNAATPTSTSTTYGMFLTRILPFKPYLFIAHQGEGGPHDSATYYTNFKMFDSLTNFDLGYTHKHFYCQIGYAPPTTLNIAHLHVQAAQSALDDSSTRFMACVTYDLETGDGIHLIKPSQDSVGVRCGRIVSQFLNGRITDGYRTPRINSVNAVSKGVIRVNFGLISGHKIKMDSMVLFRVKSTAIDSIQKLSFTIAPDSLSALIAIRDAIMTGDSISYGYANTLPITTFVRDANTSLPAERKCLHYYPITVSADSIATATDRFWVGGATDTTWNSATGWSTTSGGTGGASSPDTLNDVFLDASGNNTLVLTAASKAKSLYATSGYTASFKDKGYNLRLKSGSFIYNGPSVIPIGSMTIDNGDFHLASTTVFRGDGLWNLDMKETGVYDNDRVGSFFRTFTCAYPGKTVTSTGSQNSTSGPRILSMKGGRLICTPYFLMAPDSTVQIIDTVYGSTISGGTFSINLNSANKTYTMPGMSFSNTYLSIGNNTGGTINFNLSGNISNTGFLQFQYGTGSGFTYNINTNGYSITSGGLFYNYWDVGKTKMQCSTSTFNVAGLTWDYGASGNDTMFLKSSIVNNSKSLLFLHSSNVRMVPNVPATNTINFTGSSTLDSISVAGRSIGNVNINKSAGTMKQLGVARYGDITFTDGMFAVNAVTDTVYADSLRTVSGDSIKFRSPIICSTAVFESGSLPVFTDSAKIICLKCNGVTDNRVGGTLPPITYPAGCGGGGGRFKKLFYKIY